MPWINKQFVVSGNVLKLHGVAQEVSPGLLVTRHNNPAT
jgi:hypothetical protein